MRHLFDCPWFITTVQLSAEDMDDRIIQEQIEYYRRRASEYDATSSPPGDPLAPFGEEIERALHEFAPRGTVLEIASGTGSWTMLLLEHADHVTALDSAPEMHTESRRKLGDLERLRYVVADVLTWEPDRKYDVVFCANWLSHVPPDAFNRFWEIVSLSLAPEGRVFLVDEAADAWRHEHLREDFIEGHAVPMVRRPLSDGSTYRVVKVFWDPGDLQARLRDLGWDIQVRTSGPLFWATARRS